MNVLIWVAVVVIVLLMLLVGGRAERFNLRLFMRPFQPKYRRGGKRSQPSRE
jgi:hypothetical protein